jgi:hypothetical protein
LEFLAMFIKQRGRRTEICAFDRHGGLAQLSVSASKGVDREEQEKMQLPSLPESCAPFFRVGVVKRVDQGTSAKKVSVRDILANTTLGGRCRNKSLNYIAVVNNNTNSVISNVCSESPLAGHDLDKQPVNSSYSCGISRRCAIDSIQIPEPQQARHKQRRPEI